MASQRSMTIRLHSLQEIEGVAVSASDGGGTINVKHNLHHSLDFQFKWLTNHFTGYFEDANGNRSQAVIALYDDMDAIKFCAAYAQLIELRAGRR